MGTFDISKVPINCQRTIELLKHDILRFRLESVANTGATRTNCNFSMFKVFVIGQFICNDKYFLILTIRKKLSVCSKICETYTLGTGA